MSDILTSEEWERDVTRHWYHNEQAIDRLRAHDAALCRTTGVSGFTGFREKPNYEGENHGHVA